ncbi:MAG: alpha/beta fold hydrolase [Oscillospiraceae bacterium]
MIKKNAVEFKSTNGNDTVKGVVYLPQDVEIKGIVQICHGMCEHIGRYEDFATFLCQNGYIVCGHDHIGHGKTAPSNHMFGYFAHKKGWENLVDDTYKFTKIIKKLYTNLPIYLFGHSMGSFISRLYVSYYSYAINGFIISGTGGKNPAARAAILLCDIEIKAKGEMFRPQLIDKLAFGSYNTTYKDDENVKAWLSRDCEVGKKNLADPYCNFLFTASAFKDLFTLLLKANEPIAFKNTVNTLPILMISGDDDPVGKFGHGVTEVYQNYRKSGKSDITLKLYHQGRHEMINETNKDEVYYDIIQWLNSHSTDEK